GEAGAVLAALPAPTIVTTGSASVSVVSNPPSAAGTVLAGGATRSFTWTYPVAGSGSLSFTASASGTDENSGTALTPPAVPAGSATVQKPATLTIASVIASPSLAHLGDAIGVSVAVRNDGEASAADVALSGISASATATQAGSPTATAAQTIPGGGSAVFHSPFVAESEGSFSVTANANAAAGSIITLVASATDAAGASVSSTPVTVTVGPPGVLALRCRPQPQLTITSGQSGEARLEAQKSDGTFEDATLSAT